MGDGHDAPRARAKHYFSYIFWGALTTLVNVASFFILRTLCGAPLVASNLAAWALSVLFAFVTNRSFVFASGAKGSIAILLELARFVASRLFSGALDMALMWIFVEAIPLPELPVKVAVNAIVIVVNYLTSLAFVFKKRGVNQ